MLVDFHFKPVTPLQVQDLFDGRLKHFGIIEILNHPPMGHSRRILSDGQTFISVQSESSGEIDSLTLERPFVFSSGIALTRTIAKYMACTFALYTANQPQYWGFETKQEWDAERKRMERARTAKFYADVLQYVAGDGEAFQGGTVEHAKGEVARELISKQPSLIRPEKRRQLLRALGKDARR